MSSDTTTARKGKGKLIQEALVYWFNNLTTELDAMDDQGQILHLCKKLGFVEVRRDEVADRRVIHVTPAGSYFGQIEGM